MVAAAGRPLRCVVVGVRCLGADVARMRAFDFGSKWGSNVTRVRARRCQGGPYQRPRELGRDSSPVTPPSTSFHLTAGDPWSRGESARRFPAGESGVSRELFSMHPPAPDAREPTLRCVVAAAWNAAPVCRRSWVLRLP